MVVSITRLYGSDVDGMTMAVEHSSPGGLDDVTVPMNHAMVTMVVNENFIFVLG
jgi:hypothetical protein